MGSTSMAQSTDDHAFSLDYEHATEWPGENAMASSFMHDSLWRK